LNISFEIYSKFSSGYRQASYTIINHLVVPPLKQQKFSQKT